MLSTKHLATCALSASALFGVVACSDSTAAGTGTVGVRLTTASVAPAVAASVARDIVGADVESPLPAGSVKSIDLFIVRIDAKRQESTDEEAAEATEASESEHGGWVTIAEPNAAFDLMTLSDESNTFLGDAEVAAGSYRSFRLIIDPAKSSVTLNDAENTKIGGESIVGLKFPSAAKTGIKINLSGGGLEVTEGGTSTLVVKFDVSKSFVVRGNSIEQNGLLFKPVIHGESE
ncbi:MAG TPA: DUF4382 domain-containing protein [Candidatus Limnocylindrales bacterium]|nr:DUF4382 domain-containing protein [Candidatus Limnocylindrales bacterium]